MTPIYRPKSRCSVFGMMLLSIILSTPIQARDLVFGIYDFPPFAFFDENQQISGSIYNQILKPIVQNSDYRFSYKLYSIKRLHAEIAKGNVHFTLSVKAKNIVPLVYFSKMPVFTERLLLFANTDLNNVEDLRPVHGNRLGGMHTYQFMGLLNYIQNTNHNIHFQSAKKRNSVFKLLAKSRVDYVIDYQQPATMFFQQYPQLQPAYSTVLVTAPVYVAVSRATPNSRAILQDLVKILNRLPKN